MATLPKPGARNDLEALKTARRHHSEAIAKAERASDEIARMREATGRPDYGRLTTLIGELSLHLAKVTRPLEEMWAIRAASGQLADDDLAERLAAVEAEVAELRYAQRNKQERLFPCD